MIHFSDSKYIFAHGSKPRGIGSWLFAFDGDDEPGCWFTYRGSFSNAKKAAQREARDRHAGLIEVLS